MGFPCPRVGVGHVEPGAPRGLTRGNVGLLRVSRRSDDAGSRRLQPSPAPETGASGRLAGPLQAHPNAGEHWRERLFPGRSRRIPRWPTLVPTAKLTGTGQVPSSQPVAALGAAGHVASREGEQGFLPGGQRWPGCLDRAEVAPGQFQALGRGVEARVAYLFELIRE